MAPNRRGGPLTGTAAAQVLQEASVITAKEVAERGSGTKEQEDSYDGSCGGELRVFFTGQPHVFTVADGDCPRPTSSPLNVVLLHTLHYKQKVMIGLYASHEPFLQRIQQLHQYLHSEVHKPLCCCVLNKTAFFAQVLCS